MRDFWMLYAKKTVFAFLMLFAIASVSCDKWQNDVLEVCLKPFFADVTGLVDGEEIKAQIYCDPSEHKTKEVYERLVVTFQAPEGLDGVTVTLLSSGDGFVRFENVISKDPYYAPMTEAFSTLFLTGEPLSVKRKENGSLILRYADSTRDLTYVFDPKGALKQIEGTQNRRNISLKLNNIQIVGEN